MIESSSIINSKNYPFPDFIRYHKVLKAQKTINKSFKSIGLPNTRAEVNLSSYYDLLLNHNRKLISDAVLSIRSEFEIICNQQRTEYRRDKSSITSSVNNLMKTYELLSSMDGNGISSLFKLNNEFFAKNSFLNDFRSMNIVEVISRIIDFYNFSGDEYTKIISTNLSTIQNLIKKCQYIIRHKSQQHYIVFSSTGAKCAWDIATMSMRGIKSCQRWENDKSKALIGSIVDPNCAIIYLTDGSDDDYGERMLKRAVVRLVLNKNNEREILIERIYSAKVMQGYIQKKSNDEEYKDKVFDIFQKFINRKTKGAYPIVFANNIENIIEKYSIPNFETLNLLQEEEKSYRDSKILYNKFSFDMSKKNDIQILNEDEDDFEAMEDI